MIDYERWLIDNSERMGILPAGSQSATEPQEIAMIIPAMVGRGDPVRGQPEMTKPEMPGETAAYISKLEAALDKEQEAGCALTQVIAKLEAQVEALKLEEGKTFRVQEDRILALAAKNRELQARIDDLEAQERFNKKMDVLDRANPEPLRRFTERSFPSAYSWNAANCNWQNATWVDDEAEG